MSDQPGPLAGRAVVDMTLRLGSYAGRLLSDLGADVSRVVRPQPEPDDPVVTFRALGKRHVQRGTETRAIGMSDIENLLADAAILITDETPLALEARGLHPSQTTARFGGLVHLSITPFGLTGPDANVPASDLTILAAGGLLYLAGDPDRAPVRPFGEQSGIAAGVHGCVGALVALTALERQGIGQVVDVSAQEAVAHSIENAAQYLDCEGIVRRRNGAGPQDAGTGLFGCRDGHVYLLTTMGGHDIAWDKVVDWLDEGGDTDAASLREPAWADPAYRALPESVATFRAIFERFASDKAKMELYEAGQARGLSICPVASPRDLLENPQLTEREYFREVTVGRRRLTVPGAPYRFAGRDVGPDAAKSPARARPAHHVAQAAERDAGPLTGIRVADFTWVGAGPFLTKPLADHGADVVKIESRTRPDPIRTMRPFRDGVPGPERSGYFANRNSSKRSICLDLKDPRGLELARQLIANSDVVVNNFSAGTMDRLGLGYEEARSLNPAVVYLEMPMQGTSGPHSTFRGFGLTIGALGGLLELTGWPDRPPVGTGTNYPDHVPNPLHGAVAVLAALGVARSTGEGQYIELAQLESTINAIGPAVIEAQVGGEVLRRGNDDDVMAPHGVFPCRGDDRWCALAVRNDRDWSVLCSLFPALGDLEHLTGAERVARSEAINKVVAAISADWDRDDLVTRLREADLVASPVCDAADLLRDPQLRARRHWVWLDHPVMGSSVYDSPPYLLSRTSGRLRSPAPLLGGDTRDVCVDLLGMPVDAYEALSAEGIIG